MSVRITKMIAMFSLLMFAGVAQAQVPVDVASATPPKGFENIDMGHGVEIPAFNPEVFKDRTHWVNDFEIVIIINKANKGPTKQTLVLYKDGVETIRTKVSTGREIIEKARSLFRWHAPKKTYFSTTNTGYFGVIWMNPLHKSDLWGTKMPWSIFFDGGIAIHERPDKTEGALGTRASGGCVRVSNTVASTIYAYVQEAGKGSVPQFDQYGEPKRDANGNILRKNDFRTLIIVQNVQ